MDRHYYGASVAEFLAAGRGDLMRRLADAHRQELSGQQRLAWEESFEVLRDALRELGRPGFVYLEYWVPRLNRRADAVLLLGGVVFVVEFKAEASRPDRAAVAQVWDYALDLKYFHSETAGRTVAPVLVSTESDRVEAAVEPARDGVLKPLTCGGRSLPRVVDAVLAECESEWPDAASWAAGRYAPTPTIVEAAKALYAGHGVGDITRRDASAANLSRTSAAVDRVISGARRAGEKIVCFVTGVPGAGKTLVGLDVASRHAGGSEPAVFLSGNGPLVAVLREALARDRVAQDAAAGTRTTLTDARRRVEAFVQNVHQFRDDCLADDGPPPERVAIFDEAQRAWDRDQTARFMTRKRQRRGFDRSEPEFLLSCLDRHEGWAAVVCLVGGGQEINTGEAGIGEWLGAVRRSLPGWRVVLSPRVTDAVYAAGEAVRIAESTGRAAFDADLHLASSVRSFRSEKVSEWVRLVLEGEADAARALAKTALAKFPVVLTRDVSAAKDWVRQQARGGERFGLLASSGAKRLRPLAVDVATEPDVVRWFLDGADDVRSSFYLEQPATEFHVQGLELDWSVLVWGGDFSRADGGWRHRKFRGTRWQSVRDEAARAYQLNAYRVLLTRARQGMAIVVPEGDAADPTRPPAVADGTFAYLRTTGVAEL